MTQFSSVEKEVKEKKETVFTHYQCGNSGWSKTSIEPKHCESVVYLGCCDKDGDMFSCRRDGFIEIYKGVKGDEFN